MDTISIVCIIILAFIIGALVGLSIRPKESEVIGTLIVDKRTNVTANQFDVYSQFDTNPRDFKDGTIVGMKIMAITDKEEKKNESN